MTRHHSAQPTSHPVERFADPTLLSPRPPGVSSARRAHFAPTLAAIAVDLVVVVLVTSAAAIGRARLPIFTEAGDIDALFGLVGVPIVLGWVLVIAAHGGYAEHVMGAGTTEYKLVSRATLVAAGAVGVISFLARFQFSRGFFFLLIIIGMPSLLLGRFLLRRVIHQLRGRGYLQHRVLVAGSAAHVDEVTRVLARERWLGHDVIGAVLPAADMAPRTPGGVQVMGTTARVAAIVADSNCDIVLFAGGAVGTAQQMRRIAWDLDDHDVQIMLVPSLTDVASDRMRVRPAAGLQLMELEGPRAKRAASISKRMFDIVGACVLILIASPVLIATALAVKTHDGGPILFRQQRVGRNGKLFGCFKFRSMVVNADTMVATVAQRNKHDDEHVLFKAENDPRITAPGRLIRRLSIDETPQFFNVLRGEMSLVGPRPPLPEEVERYTDDMRRRLAVRPGVTGLWQVSGRSDLSWEDSVRLDLYYVDNWSLVQDLAIIGRTAWAVLTGRGAY
jgi:exopolysaccharide biosynthesis polyprenyl glycosylphosphotransferase